MSVGDLCNREVVYVHPDDSAANAVQLMRNQHVGDVVVVEEGGGGQRIPVGIVTDRDIVIEIVAQGVDPEAVTVRDIMGDELHTIDQGQDLYMALGLMRDQGVRRLPVVNEGGGLEGLLTIDDVIELLAEMLSDITTLIGREQVFEHSHRG